MSLISKTLASAGVGTGVGVAFGFGVGVAFGFGVGVAVGFGVGVAFGFGVGVAFGTYVAAAADPSGYLSQARLITQGELVVPVPLASRVDWPYPESSFAPLGYRPGLHAAEIVPTYPPGLPLAMALAALGGLPGR